MRPNAAAPPMPPPMPACAPVDRPPPLLELELEDAAELVEEPELVDEADVDDVEVANVEEGLVDEELCDVDVEDMESAGSSVVCSPFALRKKPCC